MGDSSLQVSPISDGWECKQRNESLALDVDLKTINKDWIQSQIPSEIFVDLLNHEKIKDPFLEMNENDVQWIGETDWLYRTNFNWKVSSNVHSKQILCFDGLDTYAIVYLNDKKILESSNMFVPYRVDVRGILIQGTNTLGILFESAFKKGKETEKKLGKLTCWNGDPSRMYVRKAQYHYSWDWGPKLMTCGIWRKVYLESYQARVSNMRVLVDVAENHTLATLNIDIEVEDIGKFGNKIILNISDSTGKSMDDILVNVSNGLATKGILIANPQLWWPAGYGDQPLYKVTAKLINKQQEILDIKMERIGLRNIRVIQRPLIDQEGTSFFFEVNGRSIFCGGSNWIPADTFLTRLSSEKYRTWLKMLVQGNQVMVRVWGGGIYEDDVFYDTCDEMGILVWQDFMFACGKYPAHNEFLLNVKAEAEANVSRLGNHACLAIFAGNNEDYQIKESLNIADKEFPGLKIYEDLLPKICEKLAPKIQYWRGSPYTNSTRPSSDSTIGDIHQWGVWHGAQYQYQYYPELIGRFVSEFGMESLPSIKTISKFTDVNKIFPQSRVMMHHNKADGHERRLGVYLIENVRFSTHNLKDYVYATQFIQSEALSSAYRGWLRQWKGPGKEYCSGALVWQFNDCWPVSSWSIIDYYFRPKPAYYTIKRILGKRSVGISRISIKDRSIVLETWAVNLGETIDAEYLFEGFGLDGQRLISKQGEIRLLRNQATEIEIFSDTEVKIKDDNIVYGLRLFEKGKDNVIARVASWPEPYKYLDIPDPNLQVVCMGKTIHVSSSKPVKGVWIEYEMENDQDIIMSDNMLDVMPGDEQVIEVSRYLSEKSITFRWLGKEW